MSDGNVAIETVDVGVAYSFNCPSPTPYSGYASWWRTYCFHFL